MAKGNVLIIGGGASGRVATHKCAQIPEVFKNITLASRSLGKPKIIRQEVKELQGRDINIEKLDAENTALPFKGEIAIGKFVDIEKPTFMDMYKDWIVSRAAGQEKS